MDWSEMQKQHAEWLERVYPRQLPDIPAAGLVEEAGELMHATLKSVQRLVWGEEARFPKAELKRKLVDAVGDVAIYACSFCNAAGWDFQEIVTTALAGSLNWGAPPLDQAATIVMQAAKFAAGPYDRQSLAELINSLAAFCKLQSIDFEEAVGGTWEQVRKRDKSCRDRPTIVCLCGSTRFIDAFHGAEFRETLAGKIVLTIGCDTKSDAMLQLGEGVKAKLDELHLRKVELADEVLVLNCRVDDKPYIGESTQRELAHARKLGKKVRFLSEEQP